MGRLPRPTDEGLTFHALNRGNNREPVFRDEDDHCAFLHALGQTQLRYPFRLYGYCLMTNHFHLLLRPEAGVSISRVLQSLSVAHTWRHHKRHRSVGHVWQGRFKSPVVQDDEHQWTVLRYIEANPTRAGMVGDLADYPWTGGMLSRGVSMTGHCQHPSDDVRRPRAASRRACSRCARACHPETTKAKA